MHLPAGKEQCDLGQQDWGIAEGVYVILMLCPLFSCARIDL